MSDPRHDLKAFLDGELDPRAGGLVADAIARDPSLKREADQLGAIGAAIRREKPISVVGRERTLERLAERGRPRARVGVAPWIWAAGAAASVALAWLSWPRASAPRFEMRPVGFAHVEGSRSRSEPSRVLPMGAVASGAVVAGGVMLARRLRRRSRGR